MDATSGKVLYNNNGSARLSMASTTKIMTALILCESGDLSREITVTPEMVYVEGTSMGLKVGMKITLEDLLYGMLLSSGNDAANATAIALGKTVDNFVSMMNSKAKELGLSNTHFETPSGLDGESHYTTAYDLACLTRYALNNETFYKACSTESVTLEYDGKKVYLSNHNRLLKTYEGAIGVKTGFTKKSGRCLVSAAERGKARIIAVTLNDGNDWQDHTSMLDYGFSLVDSQQSFEEEIYKIPVFSGENSYIEVKTKPIEFSVPSGEKIIKKECIYPYTFAPVKKGDTLGYVEYTCNSFTVARQNLVAENDVEALRYDSFLLRLKNSFLLIFRNI